MRVESPLLDGDSSTAKNVTTNVGSQQETATLQVEKIVESATNGFIPLIVYLMRAWKLINREILKSTLQIRLNNGIKHLETSSKRDEIRKSRENS